MQHHFGCYRSHLRCSNRCFPPLLSNSHTKKRNRNRILFLQYGGSLISMASHWALSVLLLTVAASIVVLCGASNSHIMSVDMGSDFWKIAVPDVAGNNVRIVLNQQSHRKTDAFVGFRGADERFFGSDAKSFAPRMPDQMISGIPLLQGVTLHQATRIARDVMRYHYNLSQDPTSNEVLVTIPVGKRLGARQDISSPLVFTAQELLGMMFSFAKATAERDAETHIREAVVIVPAAYTTVQRRAVVDAGALAGVRVTSLMHATTAAAAQFAVQNPPNAEEFGKSSKVVLILDCGATKTEAGVYRISPPSSRTVPSSNADGASANADGKMRRSEALGTVTLLGAIASDESLGGRTIDACLAQALEDDYVTQKRNGDAQWRVLQGSTEAQRKSSFSLMRAAMQAKEMLSANREAPVTVEGIAPEYDFTMKLSRSRLESSCAALWTRAVAVRDAALRSANLTLKDLDRLEVIGGGLRVPAMLDALAEGYPKKTVDRTLNADEAAALGAAFVASVVREPPLLRGALGLRIEEAFPRNVSVAFTADSNEEEKATKQWSSEKLLFRSAASWLGSQVRLTMLRDEAARRIAPPDDGNAASHDSSQLATTVPRSAKSINLRLSEQEDRDEQKQTSVVYSIAGLQDAVEAFVSQATRQNVATAEPKPAAARSDAARMAAMLRAEINVTERILNFTTEVHIDFSMVSGIPSIDAAELVASYKVNVTQYVKLPLFADPVSPSSTTTTTSSSPPAAAANLTVTSNVVQRMKAFPLRVTALYDHSDSRVDVIPLSSEKAMSHRAVLRRWRSSDKTKHRVASARNALESFLITARAQLEEDSAAATSAPQIKQCGEVLGAVQQWLDDDSDDADLTTLQQKLAEATAAVESAFGGGGATGTAGASLEEVVPAGGVDPTEPTVDVEEGDESTPSPPEAPAEESDGEDL